MSLGMVLGISLGDIVLDGDPVLPQGQSSPHFSVIVYCDQTTGYIRIPLGMAVIGLDPGDIVSDGNPAAPSTH